MKKMKRGGEAMSCPVKEKKKRRRYDENVDDNYTEDNSGRSLKDASENELFESTHVKKKKKKKGRRNEESVSDNYTEDSSGRTLEDGTENELFESIHIRKKKKKKGRRDEENVSDYYTGDSSGRSLKDATENESFESTHIKKKKKKKRKGLEESEGVLVDENSDVIIKELVTIEETQSTPKEKKKKKRTKHDTSEENGQEDMNSWENKKEMNDSSLEDASINEDVEKIIEESLGTPKKKKKREKHKTNEGTETKDEQFTENCENCEVVETPPKQKTKRKKHENTDLEGALINEDDDVVRKIIETLETLKEKTIGKKDETSEESGQEDEQSMSSCEKKKKIRDTSLERVSINEDADVQEKIQESRKEKKKRKKQINEKISYNGTKNTISEDRLRYLHVTIPWEVPALHMIETRVAHIPSEDQKNKIKDLQITIKTGVYSRKEDEQIMNNFKEFCKHHDLPQDPTPFLNFMTSDRQLKIPTLERIMFVRFLARGIEDRLLCSVYKRFRRICRPDNIKMGRFTKKEDEIIKEFLDNTTSRTPYADLGQLLDRDRLAIEKRCISLGYPKHETLKWDDATIEKFMKHLWDVTEVDSVEELKNRPIEIGEWKQMEELMETPSEKLRRTWNCVLYPRMFAKSSSVARHVKKRLLEILIERGENDWREVDWDAISEELGTEFEGFTDLKLRSFFKHMVHYHVPEEKRDNLQACLQYLDDLYKTRRMSGHKLQRIIIRNT